MMWQQNRTVDLITRRAAKLLQFFPVTKPWSTKNMLCHSNKASMGKHDNSFFYFDVIRRTDKKFYKNWKFGNLATHRVLLLGAEFATQGSA